MSLAVAKPPEAPPDARRTAERATFVLLAVIGSAVAWTAATHLALVHCRPFLAFCQRANGPSAQHLRIEATLRALRPGEADLIAVGSSLLDRDLDVEHLARSYGLDVRPVPLFGGTMAEMAMLTPQLSRARPRAVVLLVSLGLLLDHVVWPEVRVYDPHIAASLLGGRELMADRQAHASHVLGSLHFVIRHRAALRERLAGAARSRFGLESRQGGARPSARLPAAVHARFDARERDLTCASVNARALEIMARRLRHEGVPLIVVPTPGNSPLDRNEALLRRLDQCLDGIGQRTGAIVLPRPAPDDFPATEFEDALHMNDLGRRRFTDRVGLLLQHALARAGSGDALQ